MEDYIYYGSNRLNFQILSYFSADFHSDFRMNQYGKYLYTVIYKPTSHTHIVTEMACMSVSYVPYLLNLLSLAVSKLSVLAILTDQALWLTKYAAFC